MVNYVKFAPRWHNFLDLIEDLDWIEDSLQMLDWTEWENVDWSLDC